MVLPRCARLTRPADWHSARSHGRSWTNALLVLSKAGNDLERTRFGFSVSRRLGGAVVRNRVKRRISEAVRLQYGRLHPGWDVVIIARQPVVGANYAEVERAMSDLLERSGLYAPQSAGGGQEA